MTHNSPATEESPAGQDDTAASDTVASEDVASEDVASEDVTAQESEQHEAWGVAPVANSREEATRSATQLDEEGDIAADYLEELLDIADLDGDIDIEAREGRIYLSVDSSTEGDLRLLAKPETVNALQELTRIAVQAKTGSYSRLILDIGGSRAARQAELAVLVDRAISRLEAGAEAASLPPMSSYERKLVHDIVAERGFSSASEDEGRERHTVITRA